MEENFIRFKKEDLTDYVTTFMKKLGVPDDDAKIVADVIVEADTRGISSHGLIRLYSYYAGRLINRSTNPLTPIKIISETDTTALIDGGNGLGQVVGYKSMKLCIEKAKESNVAIVVARHSNHFGIAGYYSMMALEHNMIGISLTNSQPLVAPTYGRTPILGTNPISIAVPSDKEYPYVLDMATSTVPIGKIKVYEKEGKKIPLGWGIDSNGEITDDPAKIQSGGPGALLPLGGLDITSGYKGYGLALIVDILCGVLSGGANLTDVGFPHSAREADVCHFFAAIKIEAFRPLKEFKRQMDTLIQTLKNAPKAKGHSRIYIAGEKEFEIAEYNKKHGVPILASVIREIKIEGEKLGVPFSLKPI